MLIHLKRSAGEDSTPSGRNSGLRQMVRSLFMDLKTQRLPQLHRPICDLKAWSMQ